MPQAIVAKPEARHPSINRANPLSQNLLAAYPMWTVDGQLADVSGNGIHLARLGSGAKTWSGSPYGFAPDFEGAGVGDGFAINEDTSFASSSQLSVMALWKLTVSAAQEQIVYLAGTGAFSEEIFDLSVSGTDQHRFQSDYGTAITGSTISINRWYVSVATRNDSTGNAALYLDGVLEGSQSDHTGAVDVADVGVGIRGLTAREFTGQMGVVIIWTRELNAPEIASISADPFQIFRRPSKYHLWWEPSSGAAVVGHDWLAASIRNQQVAELVRR